MKYQQASQYQNKTIKPIGEHNLHLCIIVKLIFCLDFHNNYSKKRQIMLVKHKTTHILPYSFHLAIVSLCSPKVTLEVSSLKISNPI